MRKTYLYYKLALIALTAITMQSCSKDNGINNTGVIATPYSLYFGDSSGTLRHTNDGVFYPNNDFPSDGVPTLSIIAAGKNIIWVKKGVPVGNTTAHYSTDDGKDFNTSLTLLSPLSFDATIGFYAPDEKRLYMATSNGTRNGVKYNDNFGAPHDWKDDGSMPSVSGVNITSFTELKNNTMVAFDWTTRKVFTKTGIAPGTSWSMAVIGSTDTLPAGGQFAISHYNNTIVVVDTKGVNGAWYSDNGGVSWHKYKGLPAGVPLYAACAPFESGLLVGTGGYGVYALQGSSFVPSSAGLTENTIVRGIVGKENIYVNGVAVQYVYIATSQGLFRSQDMGQNWVLVYSGNMFSVY